MRRIITLSGWAIAATSAILIGCSQENVDNHLVAPTAKRVDHPLTIHDVTRNDPYYWLRDDSRTDSEVLAYIESENEYTAAKMQPAQAIKDQLVGELKQRIVDNDQSLPFSNNHCEYQFRYLAGLDHSQLLRRCDDASELAPIVDFNTRVTSSYFSSADVTISPDNRYIAWLEDHQGRREHSLVVLDTQTGEISATDTEGLGYGLVFAKDSDSIFYVQRERQTLREFQVKRYQVSTGSHRVVHEEPDEEYAIYLTQSRSNDYLFINSTHTNNTVVSIVSLADSDAKAIPFVEPIEGHIYSVEHVDETFYMITNLDAPNGRLDRVDEENHQAIGSWQTIVAHRDDVSIDGLVVRDDALFVLERIDAVYEITKRSLMGALIGQVEKPNKLYNISFSKRQDSSSDAIRVVIEGLVYPRATFELNPESLALRLLKQQTVNGVDSSSYVTKREWVNARDGVKIPVTIVHHNDTKLDGTAPIWQYGYGSYGSSMDAWFDSAKISVLDRGFVYAIAHVRGGKELGQQWYESGRLLNKKNSFNDFIDVSLGLVAKGYGDKNRLYAEGASAGGLLMGAVIEQAPDLYRGVIAGVPFVDVVTTMLDPSIPLTTFEWDEWGNPVDKEYHDYMLSYSPYDLVSAKNYPNLLVTSGLHDSQVQYFEPTKWVAKLRHHWQGDNLLLLDTNMSAGHGGASGRYSAIDEVARQTAFVLALDQDIL